MMEASSATGRLKRVHCLLKPLRERRAARSEMAVLDVCEAAGELGTFHRWLAERPTKERLRRLSRCKRIAGRHSSVAAGMVAHRWGSMLRARCGAGTRRDDRPDDGGIGPIGSEDGNAAEEVPTMSVGRMRRKRSARTPWSSSPLSR
mmetsp:Transcript_8709/g.22720  ORF Transcript_8709/g.22720 Transcript_8709/m.22720 type:complete len:147 (+) Transcript_8709:335-775(+)